MTIREIGDGFYRITGGRIRDRRTGRTYRTVVCSEEQLDRFEAAA